MSVPLLLLPLLAMLPLAQPLPDPDTAQVAFKDVEDRMTVPVQIAGAGPFRFVIDTGSERTVISRELAATLGLPAGGEVNVVAMSGTTRVGTVVIPSLRLSSVPEIGRIQAPALERAHLGGLGLLGIDTLQGHRVTIDFDAGSMAVAPATKRTRADRLEAGEILVRARSTMGQLIVTDAEVDGRQVRVVLDTGSAVSIGNLALRRLMARQTGKLGKLEVMSATGVLMQTDYGYARRFRLGGAVMSNMPIAFADAPPFRHFGLTKRPALLLGMNALRMFRRVEVDFPNREARFLLPKDAHTEYCAVRVGGRCAG